MTKTIINNEDNKMVEDNLQQLTTSYNDKDNNKQ